LGDEGGRPQSSRRGSETSGRRNVEANALESPAAPGPATALKKKQIKGSIMLGGKGGCWGGWWKGSKPRRKTGDRGQGIGASKKNAQRTYNWDWVGGKAALVRGGGD